jgi:hypothetical protein
MSRFDGYSGSNIVLLDTGNYPSYSSFLNQTWVWTGTNWVFVPAESGGATATFGVLAAAGITNTGSTVINGDIGSFPTTSETGFPPGIVTGTNHAGDSVTQAAMTALTARYNAAQSLPGGTLIVAGTYNTGTIITPGVYYATSSLNFTGGTVTLNGAGNYTFQIASTLVTASGTTILLTGGATAANVTWAVGSSATLGTATNFVGSILANTSITDDGSSVVNGQLLAGAVAPSGAVTLNDTTLTVPAGLGGGAGTTVPGRNDEVMAFDGTNVMLYGGFAPFNTSGPLQDTWVWNGSTWTQLGGPTPPGPSLSPQPFGRWSAAAAYIGNHQVVMFGGTNNLYQLLETWLWNGSTQTWSQVVVPNGGSPNARIGHMMAGNGAVSNTALLFGGQGTNSQFNDTWTYTVAGGWVKLSPATSPSVRSNANLVYDSVNNIWVMFGGKNEYNYLDETWVWNGTTWSLAISGAQNGQGPAGRIGAQMAFDATSGKTILFGGISAGTNYPSLDTWSFSGSTLSWTKL